MEPSVFDGHAQLLTQLNNQNWRFMLLLFSNQIKNEAIRNSQIIWNDLNFKKNTRIKLAENRNRIKFRWKKNNCMKTMSKQLTSIEWSGSLTMLRFISRANFKLELWIKSLFRIEKASDRHFRHCKYIIQSRSHPRRAWPQFKLLNGKCDFDFYFDPSFYFREKYKINTFDSRFTTG